MRRLGWRGGDDVLDLAGRGRMRGADARPTLFAAGRVEWEAAVERAVATAAAGAEPRYPLDEVTLELPFEVADFVDFYGVARARDEHGPALPPRLGAADAELAPAPVGYHGRAGARARSGTDRARPPADAAPITFGTCGPSLTTS